MVLRIVAWSILLVLLHSVSIRPIDPAEDPQAAGGACSSGSGHLFLSLMLRTEALLLAVGDVRHEAKTLVENLSLIHI